MSKDETTPELEQDVNQNQDESQEEEQDSQDQSDNQDSGQDDIDWKAEALKNKAILDRLNKKKSSEKPTAKKSNNNDLDYGQKAYLAASGIKGSKEFEFVQEELSNSGLDLDGLLENDYFQSRLEKFRSINKTKDAIPSGNRSGGPAVDSTEYWMSKPIEEVPKDMRAKVVNAKLHKEKVKGVFYNS